MILVFLLLAVSAFLIGFFCGYKKENIYYFEDGKLKEL